MKNSQSFLLSSIFLLAGMPGLAADNSETRFCNFQGREIALRISEEVSNDLTAAERSRIAEIAEEVCQDFYAESGLRQNSGITLSDASMAAQAQTSTVENTQNVRQRSPENESAADKSGLLGDLKVIEPEDRVRRAGLKRR
ncbi:MAG: hypothetical protein P8M72_06345 [Gammaproteobacteria bacterium]|nr:hypothetical protein [Gammaproteobacteria bacterium]